MDIFQSRGIKPMLIGSEAKAFDDPQWIFELKMDGERCIAYLDKDETFLQNKRNIPMLPKFPELASLHQQVRKKCILDGELIVMKNGAPDFFEIQRRSLMSNEFKIRLAASKYPASLIIYDVLFIDDKPVNTLPLMERKQLLADLLTENDDAALSRFIEGQGAALYQAALQRDLEGVVAKRKDSLYYFGKRTKDWLKIKNMKDDDFVICGYIEKEKGIVSIVLGQYRQAAAGIEGELIYKGHVTMGMSKEEFSYILTLPQRETPPFSTTPPKGNEQAVWFEPTAVCAVKYMQKTSGGGLRHPVFKGLRQDKAPEDCLIIEESE